MNLFKFPMRLRYYLTKPWRFFRELHYSFKYAWQRAIKGYSFYDSMDMDDFLLHVIPGMLRDIANSDSFPGIEPFETYEKWKDYCNSLADVFESLQEENWSEGQNEYYNDFSVAIDGLYGGENIDMTPEEANDVCALYWAREKELGEKRQQLLNDAFSELSKNFYYFWI